MKALVENLALRLAKVWHSPDMTQRRDHTYRCECKRPIFFRNSQCLGCGAMLGYDPELDDVRALHAGQEPGTWLLASEETTSLVYRRCANLDTPAACNWLVPAEHPSDLCISCRLNRTIPNLNDAENGRFWHAIENAKRRLVAQLLSLGLPVRSKVEEDPERGVMFDFLRSPVDGPRVMTCHGNGLITLNVEEADDSAREKTRHEMHEPYRTLLGHFRHEFGHYYWDRLVVGTPWLEKFRDLFGDEREDYAEALRRNYESGPPADWADHYISTYASVHPWEDWAECWAHYLHLVDSLETALGYGLSGDDIESGTEPFKLEDLYDPTDADAKRVLTLVNAWLELVTALNELARSMGQQDFYPFVMSRPVLRKLHFVQLVVKGEREANAACETDSD